MRERSLAVSSGYQCRSLIAEYGELVLVTQCAIPPVVLQLLHRLVGRGGSSPRDRSLQGEDIFGSESEAKRTSCWLWLAIGEETEAPATTGVAALSVTALGPDVPSLAARAVPLFAYKGEGREGKQGKGKESFLLVARW